MLKLVRYEPWDIFSAIPAMTGRSHDYDRNSENAVKTVAVVTPSVSIREDDDKFLVVMDMPGVATDQVSVTFDKGICTVKGCRPDMQKELSEEGYTYNERVHGDFQRSFRCETADPERITAKIKHGLLQITLLKYVEVQPRKIVVEG